MMKNNFELNEFSAFRVWDDNLKCHRTDNKYALTQDGKLLVYYHNGCLSGYVENDNEYLFVQRGTAWNDKNGVAIFLGDIVRWEIPDSENFPHLKEYSLWEIGWNPDKGMFNLQPVNYKRTKENMRFPDKIDFTIFKALECEVQILK